MHGGKVLWLVDPVYASQDSLQKTSVTYGVDLPLHLDDMFYKYGVRLNTKLLMDLNALPIPVKTGDMGGQPQFSFLPWVYFPVLTPISKHPIVNNLNAIKTEFASTIDTVNVPGIKKTILLSSSDYSTTADAPARISLETLMKKPDERLYNRRNIPVAVLLEGKFTSLYKNRIPPEIQNSKEIAYKDESDNSAMIVIADGDIIKNQVRVVNGQPVPYPLGYDRYTQQTFGNKDLILNAVNYLCDNSGLLSVRSRELKLRILDKTKVENNKFVIQVINTVFPLLLITIMGIIFNIVRKRKYTRI
jgi:ABC-2 type transport system permease protein